VAFDRLKLLLPLRAPVLLRLGILLAPVSVALALALILVLTGTRGAPPTQPAATRTPSTPPGLAPGTPGSPDVPLVAVAPPVDLPVVDYRPVAAGFPNDPAPASTARLVEGLHPTRRMAAYDAPGGQPKAYLDPRIGGVEVTMPIVERRAGWLGVLMPSANRTIAWLPADPGPWTRVALRDHLVVVRSTHQLFWFRDDALVQSWPVTLGAVGEATPLGRTFILGRAKLAGAVYADTEVFALGAVPDDPFAVPSGLRGAHIGLHTWHNDDDLGKNTTNGCIRLTRDGQRRLLGELRSGTEVVVVDVFTPPSPAVATP
jgi:hypothetical protein